MPGIPLVARETTCSRAAEQMCRQESRLHLSAEEEAEAEESLAVYCKPVELYNIIQRRSVENPSYLQRCMRYNIEAKHKRRIQLTVSLHLSVYHGLQIQNIFPLYIMVARPASTSSIDEKYVRYHFKRCITLSTFAGDEGTSGGRAKFFLPESNKLSAEMKCGSLAILFISCVEPVVDHMNFASFQRQGGQCIIGKIPMEILDLSCGKSPNLREGSETILTVDLYPCVIKASCVDGDKSVSFQKAPTPAILASMQQLEVLFTAEEIGAKDQSPYNSYSSSDIPSSSLPHMTRLKIGNVAFNYMYYNNRLQRTEVTEDFSCPFCLVKCASFKGLQWHLPSSHDLFKYEFWSTEEYQAVNVFARADTWRSEIFADRAESLNQPFSFTASHRRKRKPRRIFPSTNHVHPLVLESDLPMETNEPRSILPSTNHVHPLVLESDLPMETNEPRSILPSTNHVHPLVLESDLPMVETNELRDENVERGVSIQDTTRVTPATAPSVDPTSTLTLPVSSITIATTLQFAKTRKLSAERDPKNNALLQKRQFFHSHRAQPMSMEEVLSDQDSEDEIDDDVADLEDRRMLDDFIDVTKDEKQMMYMWNSFTRRQRVLVDGHIPWACEAFSKLHAAYLVQTPTLLWCWRIFMMKLWNHGLLDARTMNNCNIIFEQQQSLPKQDIPSMESLD